MFKSSYYMGFAIHAAAASKDTTKVGAVLVSQDGYVCLTAYNGPPKGVRDTADRFERPTKYLFASHAEQNIIAFAAREGISTRGCRLYVTHQPCSACMKSIIQAGIKKVVYGDGKTSMEPSDFAAARTMANEACLSLTEYIEPRVDLKAAAVASISDYVNDLKNMTDEQIEKEINDVSELVDTETSWLEALCVERNIRSGKS